MHTAYDGVCQKRRTILGSREEVYRQMKGEPGKISYVQHIKSMIVYEGTVSDF